MPRDTEENGVRKGHTEVPLKQGPAGQKTGNRLGKGSMAFLAVEAAYAKTQKHEKLGNWSIWLARLGLQPDCGKPLYHHNCNISLSQAFIFASNLKYGCSKNLLSHCLGCLYHFPLPYKVLTVVLLRQGLKLFVGMGVGLYV